MLSTIGKYAINVIDMRNEEPWEGKSICVFYVDMLTGKEGCCGSCNAGIDVTFADLFTHRLA